MPGSRERGAGRRTTVRPAGPTTTPTRRGRPPAPGATGAGVEVALVDRTGVIVAVNDAWHAFSRHNGGDPGRTGVGVSYLAVCDGAGDDPVAREVGDALRTALTGDLPAPLRVVVPCHSPDTSRWFDTLVSSRFDDQGSCVGATVSLSLAVPPEPSAAAPEPDRQRAWRTASTRLTWQLFAGTAEPPLALVLRHAMEAADAEMATLIEPREADDDVAGDARDRAVVLAAVGALSTMKGSVVDLDRTLAGRVVRAGGPLLVTDGSALAADGLLEDLPWEVGSVVAVPLLGLDDRGLGVVTVARRPGRVPFTAADRNELSDFATHAGLALELDRARGGHEPQRGAGDRDRLASELSDEVVRELFTVGMALQEVLGDLPRSEHRARLEACVDALDDTIRHIRATVLGELADRAGTTAAHGGGTGQGAGG